MAIGEILKVRYVGRSANVIDTIRLLRNTRDRDRRSLDAELEASRRNLARKLRAAKQRLQALELRRAEQTASVHLASRLAELAETHQKSLQLLKHEGLRIATKVAQEVLAENTEALSRTLGARIRRELTRLRSTRVLSVELSPEDIPVVRTELQPPSSAAGFDLVPNPALARGDARLVTAAGSVTLDWKLHLKQLARELEKAFATSTARSLQSPA